MSVVSDLTGLSELNSQHPHAQQGGQSNHGSPVHAKSLLSSQLDPTQVLTALSTFGGLQTSKSFDTSFDTALPALPEETPSVLLKREEESSSSVASSERRRRQQQQQSGAAAANNRAAAPAAGGALPRDQGEELVGCIDFLQDPPDEMTLSRRLALHLMRFGWYYKPKVLPRGEEGDGEDEAVGMSMVFAGGVGQLSPTATEAYPFSHSRRETPSLEKAWACTCFFSCTPFLVMTFRRHCSQATCPRSSYLFTALLLLDFEHVALPRHLVKPKDPVKKNIVVRCFRKLFCKGSKELTRAEPGEREYPTKLYEPVFTPHKQLGDFGLGIGLYFSTLRAMMVRERERRASLAQRRHK
jgi:hypothetical protein